MYPSKGIFIKVFKVSLEKTLWVKSSKTFFRTQCTFKGLKVVLDEEFQKELEFTLNHCNEK